MIILVRHQFAILFPALLIATLALACASGGEPAPAAGFYAGIAVEFEPSPDDPLARFGIAEGQSVIRWWYAPDPLRWRWEIETVGTIIDDGVALTVVNGDASWEYDDRSNTYRRGIFGGLPSGVTLLPTFSAPVGPANAETTDALIDQWRERGDGTEVGLAGEAMLLGRRTQVAELRPASGGVTRAFIDPARMFIMRWAVDGEDQGQSYRAEVTALDYDTEIDASRFTFDPPAGVREVEAPYVQTCSSTSGPIGGASFPAEPGFLRPAYTPARYHSTGAGSEGSTSGGCGPVGVWALLEPADGAYLLLRQRVRPSGIPRSARSWQSAGSGLDEAYRRAEDGVLSLLWRAGDIVAVLETDSVSFEELLRIAESYDLVPSAVR